MKLSELLQDGDRFANRLTVPVLLSADHADAAAAAYTRVEEARKVLDRAQAVESGRLHAPRVKKAEVDLAAAETAYEAASEAARHHVVDFVVESIPSDEWEELVAAHPPTDEQREQVVDLLGNGHEFNPRTFPEAAVAVCLAEPEVDSIEDVKALRSKIPDAVWQQLWHAVYRVNRGKNLVPKSLTASATTPASDDAPEQRSS